MKTYAELAKVAYEGYCRLRLNTEGDVLLAWERLSNEQQAWWQGAARDVAAEVLAANQ